MPKVLRKVAGGEDVAIVSGDQIIELKATSVVSWEDSYLCREYDISKDDWNKFKRQIASRRQKGKDVRFEGTFDPKKARLKAISFEPALLKEIRAKPAAERREIGERIAEAQRCFGDPHLHKGVGLRKLQDDAF